MAQLNDLLVIGLSNLIGSLTVQDTIYAKNGENFIKGSYSSKVAPLTLTANRTLSIPDVSGVIATIPTSGTAVGSATKPIYLTGAGVATASNATVGSGIIPIYMNAGTITASTSTVGANTAGAAKPIFMNAGTLTALSVTSGATDRPTYLNAGAITPTTYRMAATNTTATGSIAITNDLPTGIWYVSGTSDILGQSDGVVIANQYSSSQISEIYQDYRTGKLAIRGKNNGTWQSWLRVLDSSISFQTNLGSTSAGTLSALTGTSISLGVTGTLPIANGGTGATAWKDALTNLQVIRLYCGMVPYGTAIGSDVDLNTTTYTKVGNYYCSANATVTTLTNCPVTCAFMMQVFSPLATTIDNESTHTWVYRLRKLMTYNGDEYTQYVYSGSTAGTFKYGTWKKVVKTNDNDIAISITGNAATATTATTATNANNLKINDTTANTNYYILGATAGGGANQTVYRAFNASGTANTAGVYFNGASGVLYGAAWNDYAEFREIKEEVEAGRVVCETGEGDLILSNERLQPGAEVVSDTFGFAIGETTKCKTPIAASGRVLAYPYENREIFKAGDAVCAGPNGTVSKMTREEIINYPDRIIGTVSEIPDYETWGYNHVKVNNRIWIRIR